MNGFSSGGPELPTDLPSASIVGAAQQATIAVSSAWSALYFSLRIRDVRPTEGVRARRVAAGVLALLFTAVGLEALAELPVASTAAEVARRTPLMLATVSTALIVSYRPRVAR